MANIDAKGKAEKEREARDRLVIKTGLQLYIKNARAAAGTMKGLNKDEQSQQLIAEADDIQDRLLPKYDDQTALELTT